MVRVYGNVSDNYVHEIREVRPIFVLVLGTTDTSLIPGITIAGASPELTHYTPAADAEYLVRGRCEVIPVPPMTPDGKPTPALVSRACIKILNIPVIVAVAGVRIRPLSVPYIDLGGEPGRDIRTGQALDRHVVERIISNGAWLGSELAKICKFLIVGESIPAGTTTAMAVMIALGYNAWGRVSSASPQNPVELKKTVVREALQRAGLLDKPTGDPVEAVSKVGDPVIVGVASIAMGALRAGARVLLAGGTQMCAVTAVLRRLMGDLDPDKIAIGTTRWIVEDKSADMIGLLSEIWPNYALLVSEFSLGESKYEGLRAYEQGFVKEGVGMGGLLCTCEIKGVDNNTILRTVEDLYEKELLGALKRES